MAQISALLPGNVDTAVLTATSSLQAVVLTFASIMTADLVRVVPTVVHVVTHVVEVNTGTVGAFELIEHAWLRFGSTDGHVVLV